MSKLDELIQQLCPNGVEYKKIGEIFDIITDYTAAGSFADIAKNVKYSKSPEYAQLIRTTDIKSKFTNNSSFVYIDEKAFKYLWKVNIDKESIIMPNVGNCGEVYYIKPEMLPNKYNVLGPNAILMRANNYNLKFLYYCLDTRNFKKELTKITSTTGQTKFNKTNLKELLLPVPSLEVQDEIVRILDNYTKLSLELKSKLSEELKARQKQYKYYRDELFKFNNYKNIKYVPLGKIATITRGGNFQKKHFIENGFPCIHYGQIYTRYGLYADKTFTFISDEIAQKSKIAKPNDIVMAVTSENIDDVCKSVAWIGNKDIAVSGHTAIIRSELNAKYLTYYFHTSMFYKQKLKYVHGTKVIEVTPNKLNDVLIPVVSKEKQKEIVSILDRLYKLCNDISQGLPAEIELRQKQYEYYRDKLLTFKELKVKE